MSQIIYKNIDKSPINIIGGNGVWLHDQQGKQYLDTCGGVAVSSLGHCHPRIVEAIKSQADQLAWAHAGSFTTEAAEQLASLLVKQSKGMYKAQFLSGGSEVMELGLKIAFQYHYERGEPQRTILISRRQSYHGSTLGMLAISGNSQRRSIFEHLLAPCEFVSPCYAYRDRAADETMADYTDRLAKELEDKILAVGADKVAAFTLETVVGSTNGAVPAEAGYLQKIKAVCERYGVLLILDEVMAGMGRTGHTFAYLEDGITPDMVMVGKGLGAGYQPLAAVLVSQAIHEAMATGSGVLQNGQTHVNHPFACAIGLEVQQTIIDDNLLANVLARGEQMRGLLQQTFADADYIGDIRGRGLFLGVEFVTDRPSKTPYQGGGEFAAALKKEAFNQGLLIYPGSGTVDGRQGNHVLFAPPFIATSSDIDEMVSRFNQVVRRVVER